MDTATFDEEIRALSHLSSQARTAAARLRWRQAMLTRGQRIARVLRMLPRVMCNVAFVREKAKPGWHIHVNGQLVMVIATYTPGKSIEQLLAPIVVRVMAPSVVDIAPLETLEHRGEIEIVEGAR